MYASEVAAPAVTLSGMQDMSRTTKPTEVKKAVQEQIMAVLQRHKRHIQRQEEPRAYAKASREDSLAAISPWLDRTKWRNTYRGVHRDVLKAMVTNPRY